MTNCFCAYSSVILVFISLIALQHQNDPLVSAETIRHSSTYIILYITLQDKLKTIIMSNKQEKIDLWDTR